MIRERHPLRFFGWAAGMLIFFIPFVILYAKIYHPVHSGYLPIGAMFIVMFLGILGGFFTFTGIMLHGVNRISKKILEITGE